MSTATKSGAPARSAASAAPITPPVGPEPSRRDRAPGDVVGRHHAAGRLHDQQRARVARAPQRRLTGSRCSAAMRGATYALTSVVETRSNSGPRGITSCEQRDVVDVGELLADDLGRAPLVVGVHEGEQEHHRDRPHAELPAAAARRAAPRPRRGASSTLPSKSIRSGIGMRARRRAIGGGRRVRRVPDLLLVHPAHLDLVAVALGDEQAGGRAVHLDHRVVGGRGAVHERCRAARRARRATRPKRSASWPRPFITPRRLVVERGRRLVEHDLARGRHADEVGERAPDVDADPVAHVRLRSGRVVAARAASVASSSTASVRSSSEPVSTTP